MVLTDLHAHTSGISRCCHAEYKEIIGAAKEKGIDAIVLTNHYQKSYLRGTTSEQFIESYINEYINTKEYAKTQDFKVFWGIEVTMELYPDVHMLIYGTDTDFLRNNPLLYDMTQQELYDCVKSNSGLLIQAHPYRNGTAVLDAKYLDGVEINCHPLYKRSYSRELIKIAEDNGLVLTCGGDYHADTYRPVCGMYIPEETDNDRDLAEYIISGMGELCIHEPETGEIIKKKFV